MTSYITYRCAKCGQRHETLPALGYNAPFQYHELDQCEKESMAELSEDYCVIRHPEQTDYFIRTVLSIPINDSCETLDYGVWVSISENSFQDYTSDTCEATDGTLYFGMICNELSGYGESTIGLHADVRVKANGFRPQIVLHDTEHLLFGDCENGISFIDAERRVETVLRNVED